jgi:mono/diheme cytochrome c family protein
MRSGVFKTAGPARAAMSVLVLGLAQATMPCAAASDAVARGKELYLLNGCHSCHGTVGQGGERSGAPKLAPEPYPFDAFKVLIRTPREQMPRYDPKFVTDEQLLAIHQYLASIPKGLAARDIPILQALPR